MNFSADREYACLRGLRSRQVVCRSNLTSLLQKLKSKNNNNNLSTSSTAERHNMLAVKKLFQMKQKCSWLLKSRFSFQLSSPDFQFLNVF